MTNFNQIAIIIQSQHNFHTIQSTEFNYQTFTSLPNLQRDTDGNFRSNMEAEKQKVSIYQEIQCQTNNTQFKS